MPPPNVSLTHRGHTSPHTPDVLRAPEQLQRGGIHASWQRARQHRCRWHRQAVGHTHGGRDPHGRGVGFVGVRALEQGLAYGTADNRHMPSRDESRLPEHALVCGRLAANVPCLVRTPHIAHCILPHHSFPNVVQVSQTPANKCAFDRSGRVLCVASDDGRVRAIHANTGRWTVGG